MTHLRNSFLVLFLVLGCQSTLSLAEDGERKAYLIELFNQIPETVITSVRPLLAEGDNITTFNSEIIVTTSPLRINAIRELVQKLDRPMRNLLITVKNNNDGSVNSSESGFSGESEHNNIHINTGQPITSQKGITISHEGIGYSMHDSKQTFANRDEQQIRAVEGRAAFIYTGQSISIPSRDRYGNIYTNELDANRGFYITARITGSNVVLEISLTNDSFEPDTAQPVMNTERLATTVSGNEGEWISLGNIQLGDSGNETTLVKKITTESGSLGNISVKITSMD